MNPLTLVILVGMLATVVALAAGIVSMMHGGKFDREHSGQLMMTRVGAQGLTLALLIVALLLANL
ncbi:MAG TPA: twin transmembrane helix small protein [Gammaproteobacteria bacterium]